MWWILIVGARGIVAPVRIGGKEATGGAGEPVVKRTGSGAFDG